MYGGAPYNVSNSGSSIYNPPYNVSNSGINIYSPTDPEALAYGSKDYNYSRQLRHGFIRKVYGILCVQLTITTALTFVCVTVEPIKNWMITNGLLIIIPSAIGLLITSLVLFCSQSAARNYPCNYILLFAFTLFEAILVSSAAAYTDAFVVAQAALCTIVVTFGLTLFAFQTKHDFTGCYGIMFVLFLGFFCFGILSLFFRPVKWLEITLSSIGALIFSFYLVMDTQLIIGRGKLSLTEDDYIIGALMLYIDIMNLFLYLMRLMEELNSPSN